MMAKALGDDFDIEIVEGHHHHKVLRLSLCPLFFLTNTYYAHTIIY
jgi:hypothetical protein